MASKAEQKVLQVVVDALRDVPVSLQHRSTLEDAADVLEEMADYQNPYSDEGTFRTLENCITTVRARRVNRGRRINTRGRPRLG